MIILKQPSASQKPVIQFGSNLIDLLDTLVKRLKIVLFLNKFKFLLLIIFKFFLKTFTKK
jgi:hypothetical protein